MPPVYPLDPTGLSPGNLITDEVHVLTEINDATYRILIPTFAPFYLDNLVLKHTDTLGTVTTLLQDVDYTICLPYVGASRSIGKMIYGGLTINTILVNGLLSLTYQTLGGDWTADASVVRDRLVDLIYNPRITVWDVVTNKPNQFPPINHPIEVSQIYGFEQLIEAVNGVAQAVVDGPDTGSGVINHFTNTDNPHETTAEQVGLGEVQNLPVADDQEVQDKEEVNKYVTLRQLIQFPIADPGLSNTVDALTGVVNSIGLALSEHIANENNPHQVTKAHVLLGDVENLPIATPTEITDQTPVNKYVTLAQVLELMGTLTPVPPTTPILTAASYYLFMNK